MQFINIHDAKTNLSKYLEQLALFHQPIIICRNGKPIAQITEYKPRPLKKIGLLKGKIKIGADFDQLPDEWVKYFE